MELENIEGHSFIVLQREVGRARRRQPSSALFVRMVHLVQTMGQEALQSPDELKAVLRPYVGDKERLREAVAAWVLLMLVPDGGSAIMSPDKVASLITASVEEVDLRGRLPEHDKYATWLSAARKQHSDAEWPEVAARWFVEMVYPFRRRKLSLYTAAAMLGKECEV